MRCKSLIATLLTISTIVTLSSCAGRSRYVSVEGIVVQQAGISASSQSKNSGSRSREVQFDYDDFVDNWDALKREAAAGEGALLDAFAEEYHFIYKDRFIEDLRTRQFEKVFQHDKRKGWKHVLWMSKFQPYVRRIRMQLPNYATHDPKAKCNGLKHNYKTSPLAQLVMPSVERYHYYSGCIYLTIKDDATLLKNLQKYDGKLYAHPVDMVVYNYLSRYAKSIRYARMTRLLKRWQRKAQTEVDAGVNAGVNADAKTGIKASN